MRNTPSASIRLGIKAFNQCHNVRRLPVAKVPLVRLVGFDRVRLALAVRVDQFGRDQVTVWYGMGICDGERVLVNRLDGTPHVDDLVSTLEQGGRLVGQVVSYAVGGCVVALVNMHTLNRAPE